MSNIRDNFKILDNNNIIYLDSAASSLVLDSVVQETINYYNTNGCNVHRGIYSLSYNATIKYESARERVAKYMNCEPKEVVFTSGTSAGLNLIAMSFGKSILHEGDEVLTTLYEHHSSHMPWFNLCRELNAKLKYLPVSNDLRITTKDVVDSFTEKTKVLVITGMSNVLGYNVCLEEIIKEAHKKNIIVVVDGAQHFTHQRVDVKKLDCDFYCWSAHKTFGPSGVGIMYGKYNLLDKMQPIFFGGDMAHNVSKDMQSYKDAPYKFETGTPNVAGVLALHPMLEFLEQNNLDDYKKHIFDLTSFVCDKLNKEEHITIYNPYSDGGLVTFNIEGVHPHDVASFLDTKNICIRAGHHCAMLIHNELNVEATLRASFQIYNTLSEAHEFVEAVLEARDFFMEVLN